MSKKLLTLLIVVAFVFETFAVSFSSAAAPSSPIEKIIFVYNAHNGGGGKPSPQDTGSYKLMGVSWPTNQLPVSFEVNSAFTNPDGSKIKSADAIGAILMGANEWDDGVYSKSEGYSWAGVSANLFANTPGTTTATTASLDQHNEIMWSDLGNQGTIAITTVWYNRFTKQIVEFDMQFNTYYKWSVTETGTSNSMDIQNIATHELGHAVGLADLYKPTATQETMYGYSNFGVTSARDLYLGDQAGITKLYG